MRAVRAFLIPFISISAGCNMADSESCEIYARTVAQIAERVVDLTSADDLFDSDDFIAIYENPSEHLVCAKEKIADPTSNDLEKSVAALSMQRVGLEGYLGIAEAATAQHRKGMLPLETLELVLMPPVRWGDVLLLHYDDERVNQLYRDYLELDGPTEANKAYVRDHLLTGAAAAQRKD